MGKVIQGPWSGGGGGDYVPAGSVSMPYAPMPSQAPPLPALPPPGIRTTAAEPVIPSLFEPESKQMPELEEVLRDIQPGGIFAGSVPNSILEREPERRPAPPPPPAPTDLVPVQGRPIRFAMGSLSSAQNTNLLGLSTVAVPLGVFAGYKVAGAYGSVGGALLMGAAINAFRAAKLSSPEDVHEATVSGTYALLGTLVGGYLIWKGWKR